MSEKWRKILDELAFSRHFCVLMISLWALLLSEGGMPNLFPRPWNYLANAVIAFGMIARILASRSGQ